MKKMFIFSSLITSALFAINLNTASMQELEKIKGIGPAKAKAIIEYRKNHKIKSADDLKNIKGFDAQTISNVKNNVIAKKHLSKDNKKSLTEKTTKLKNKKENIKDKLNSKKEAKNNFKNQKKKAASKALKKKKAALKNKIKLNKNNFKK